MQRLAVLATGRRTRVIVVTVWLVIGVWCGVAFQPRLQESTRNDSLSYLPRDSDSARMLATRIREFESGAQIPAVILFTRADGQVLDGADRKEIRLALERVDDAGIGIASPVVSPLSPQGAPMGLVAADGRAMYGLLPLDAPDSDVVIPAVDDVRRAVDGLPGSLVANVTGPAGIAADSVEVFGSVDKPLLLATVVLVLVLLLAIYRSPIIPFIPLVTVALAYNIAAGVAWWLIQHRDWTVNGQTTAVLVVLMFGAGTDYCLLLVSRYREALRTHDDPHEAIVEAVRRTTPAILSSGLTVIVAMLALLAAASESPRTMGPPLAIGVAIMVLAGLTLLPALLSIGGRIAYWPRVPRVTDTSPRSSVKWRLLGWFVQRHPIRALAIGVGVLVVLSLGNLGSPGRLGFGDVAGFRSSTDATTGFARLAEHFPAGANAPGYVLVSADRDSLGNAVVAVSDWLRGDRRIVSVGPPESSRDGTRALVSFTLRTTPYGRQALEDLPAVRRAVASVAREHDATAIVGGPTAEWIDSSDAQSRDDRVVIPLILAVIGVVLVLLLRSLVAPLHLVASVVLSFLATLGLTSVLFTEVLGHPGVSDGYALFLFIFVVALGVDYNIFLVTRIREEAARYGTASGTVEGLAYTGSVITSAGMILAGTFLTMVVLPLYAIMQVGLGIAIGVLLDTFVVRSFLVPACMVLLGERNWWPRHPRRDSVTNA